MEQFVNMEERALTIAEVVESTLAKPNCKEFNEGNATLYAVVKLISEPGTGRIVHGLRWVAVFPPQGQRVGVYWQDFVEGSEEEAKRSLQEIDEQSAAYFYKGFKEQHEKPIHY